MKRFLALLLTLVMLVSVCGLQAFAADGDMTAILFRIPTGSG